MSPERRGEGGIHRSVRRVSAPPGAVSREERWPGANDEKVARLRVRSLKRQAGSQGFELRHSSSGYTLIDSARKFVGDRNDLSLDEIEVLLDRAREQ